MNKPKKTSPKGSTKKRTTRKLSEGDLKQVAGGRKAGGRPLEYIKIKGGIGGWDLPGGTPTGIKVY